MCFKLPWVIKNSNKQGQKSSIGLSKKKDKVQQKISLSWPLKSSEDEQNSVEIFWYVQES